MRAASAVLFRPVSVVSLHRGFRSCAPLLARVERTFKRRVLPSTAPVVVREKTLPASAAAAGPSAVGPAQQQPGGGGLLGVVAEGFSFGIGSAIARNLVHTLWPGDSPMTPPPVPPAAPPADTFEHSYGDESERSGGGNDDDDDLF